MKLNAEQTLTLLKTRLPNYFLSVNNEKSDARAVHFSYKIKGQVNETAVTQTGKAGWHVKPVPKQGHSRCLEENEIESKLITKLYNHCHWTLLEWCLVLYQEEKHFILQLLNTKYLVLTLGTSRGSVPEYFCICGDQMGPTCQRRASVPCHVF